MAKAAPTKTTKAVKSAQSRTSSKGARRARGSLSREEILDGAQFLVEQHGLKQLSMPSLAKHLKSGVTSIYWYFRSKDDLIAALTERVTSEMYARLAPVGNRPWDEELVNYFCAFREELQREPIYTEVFSYRSRFVMSRPAVNQAIFDRLEQEIGVLVGAGLTEEQAARVYTTCSVYTRGFVMIEHGLEVEDIEPGAEGALNIAASRLDPARYPILTKLDAFERVFWPGEDKFRLGLQLIVEGLRVEYGLPKARAPRRRTAAG
jgi:AcrR family transcriptional regulator